MILTLRKPSFKKSCQIQWTLLPRKLDPWTGCGPWSQGQDSGHIDPRKTWQERPSSSAQVFKNGGSWCHRLKYHCFSLLWIKVDPCGQGEESAAATANAWDKSWKQGQGQPNIGTKWIKHPLCLATDAHEPDLWNMWSIGLGSVNFACKKCSCLEEQI